MTLFKLGDGKAACDGLDDLTRGLRAATNVDWAELPDWCQAWREVYGSPPTAVGVAVVGASHPSAGSSCLL